MPKENEEISFKDVISLKERLESIKININAYVRFLNQELMIPSTMSHTNQNDYRYI